MDLFQVSGEPVLAMLHSRTDYDLVRTELVALESNIGPPHFSASHSTQDLKLLNSI
jgi:hypothetical protein